MASYQATKEHHDKLAALSAGLANQYPGAYAFVRDGEVASVAEAETPEQARGIIGEALQETLNNIHRTREAVQSDDLDHRDMWPLHEQLYANSNTWTEPFYQWVAKDEVKGHERAEFWLDVGLGTLSAIGFLVANLVTAGTATFFIAAGVGLGAGGALAGPQLGALL